MQLIYRGICIRGKAEAFAVCDDNFRFVLERIDFTPYIKLPKPEKQVFNENILLRLKALSKVARPNKRPEMRSLEIKTKRYLNGSLSDKAFFDGVSKMALRNGVSPDFVERVKNLSIMEKQNNRGSPIFSGKPVKLRPLNIGMRPKRFKASKKKPKSIMDLFGGLR